MPEYAIETPNLLCQKKFKSQPTAGKVMLILLWEYQGQILEHYQQWGVTINSAHYSEILHDRLKPAI
jgi:hypothetical protein